MCDTKPCSDGNECQGLSVRQKCGTSKRERRNSRKGDETNYLVSGGKYRVECPDEETLWKRRMRGKYLRSRQHFRFLVE